MSKKMWLLLASVGVVAFIGGYGATAKAFHANWYGYFFHTYDTNGLEVLPPWGGRAGCQGNGWALPSWIDTPGEFINFTVCKLGGSTQERRGAAFIISTMIGQNNYNPTAAQINEFAARVNYAAARGWMDPWAVNGCILPNTYYQDSGSGDVAKYSLCGSGGGNAINFYTVSSWYVIKRFCANPVGSMAPLAPAINFSMSGSSSVNDNTVIPGQLITFSHNLTNNGPTSNPYNVGWGTWGGPSAGGPWSGVASGNAGTFGAGQTKPGVSVESNYMVPANAVPNSQICRRIDFTPLTENGGTGSSNPACATVQYNFTLTPSITVSINSVDGPVTTGVAQPGDTVTFTYTVINSGTTVSQTATCTYRQATYPGYSTAPPTTLFTPSGANCAPSRTFPAASTTTIATETIAAASANVSYCRSLVVSPVSFGGGASAPYQACVPVASKPYLRVYGGDVVAGGGVETAPNVCTVNAAAAIIGWNRRAAGTYAGAGVQFAAYAMSTIFDTATVLGYTGASVAPTGLSFGNTVTSVANGRFGGSFGSAPCIDDYYARRPTTTTVPPATIGAMTSGVYGANANTYFGTIPYSYIDPGERITVYIDGNVYINTNVVYNGSWSSATAPSFQLIVRGDIYIDLGVGRLDGIYIAQPRTNGTGGIIYTCASTSPVLFTLPALSGTLATQCRDPLTINGSFIAKQVRFMRTAGTLRQSFYLESWNNPNIAERFNYGPALWMPQPTDASGAAKYDAINSLPPVL